MKTRDEFITAATLNLTRKCNLNCSYCFSYRTGGDLHSDMSFEVAKKCVDFLFDQAEKEIQCFGNIAQPVEVSFWGGEPLIMWDLLKEITLYAVKLSKERNIPVVFGGTTNGTLLTEDKFDFLDEYRIFFMITLDGTEETHNRHRSGWKETVKNAEKVLKRWPFYRVRCSPYPEAISRFYDDIKFLVDLGFNDIMYSPVYEFEWTSEHWDMFYEQQKRVVDEIIIPLFKKGRRVRIEHLCTYSQRIPNVWKYPCGAGKKYVGFDVDGSFYPCHRFIKFNDVREWHEKEYVLGHVDHGLVNTAFRKKFIKVIEWDECKSCEYFDHTPCYGGCYAVTWDFKHSLDDGPYSPICENVKMLVRSSDYLVDRLREEKLLKHYFLPERSKPISAKDTRSCICYNMCYAEGTPDEIVDIDYNVDFSCLCYMSRFQTDVEQPARPLNAFMKEFYRKVDRIYSLLFSGRKGDD